MISSHFALKPRFFSLLASALICNFNSLINCMHSVRVKSCHDKIQQNLLECLIMTNTQAAIDTVRVR